MATETYLRELWQWLTVELHSVVEDLCNYDLMDDAD